MVANDARARRCLVHYHTDCPWFAGCETLLANLLMSPLIRDRFAVSLSYRASDRYTAGLQERVQIDFPVEALDYPEPSYALPGVRRLRGSLARLGRVVSRLVATVPLLLYETWVLYRLLRVRRPDILHVNNGGYPAALSARAAVIAGRFAGVPRVLMTVNNLAEDYRRPDRQLEFPLDRVVARCVNVFTTGSWAAATRLRQVLRLAEGRSLPIANGGDLRAPTETVAQTRDRLGLTDGGRVAFGIVGLLEPRKGHLVLLEAVRRLVAQSAQARRFVLFVLGDGPLRGELERVVADEGLSEYCRFLGHEPNGLNIISALDVLVLASIAHEDFPNVILEAMGMGKPVISTRIAGTAEQVADGETGLLVPPGDPEALWHAVERLLVDEPTRRAMGRAGRARFQERFTAEVSARRYAALYDSLLEEVADSRS